ncbi:MAG: hypothetical protein QF364_05740 [Candidatus Poseidoniaceae archaeon]|nr:hypothetical protein [Candidatus Poseidoniaceae archaeon]
MITLEDLKTNRDTQITVVCIAFFLIAFPLYFSIAASGVSGVAGTRGVGDYQINGNLTYVQLTDGIEYIADGDTLMIDNLHTDAIDDAEDLNIVGVRVLMSYGEDEEAQGLSCTPLTQGQAAADTISGTAMHAGFNGTADGQNNGGSGNHEVVVEWFNSSMVGAEVSGLSESEIISQIDSMGAGLGAYSAEIGVSAEAGNAPGPGCSRSDNGEEVTFSVELIVFDYSIAPVFNEDEL